MRACQGARHVGSFRKVRVAHTVFAAIREAAISMCSRAACFGQDSGVCLASENCLIAIVRETRQGTWDSAAELIDPESCKLLSRV